MSSFRLAIGVIALLVALGLAACSGGKDGRSSGSPLAPTSLFSTSASMNSAAGNSEGAAIGSQLEHDADDLSDDAPSDDAPSGDDSSGDDSSSDDDAVGFTVEGEDADLDSDSDSDSDADSDADSDSDDSGPP